MIINASEINTRDHSGRLYRYWYAHPGLADPRLRLHAKYEHVTGWREVKMAGLERLAKVLNVTLYKETAP